MKKKTDQNAIEAQNDPRHHLLNRDPDLMFHGRSIYEVSKFEIFWRNFIAGFARGLGNFLFTLLILVIITGVAMEVLRPFFSPVYQAMTSINQILNTINQAPPAK